MIGSSLSQRKSHLIYWFKSYSNFAEYDGSCVLLELHQHFAVLVLLSAHAERFIVSRMRNFSVFKLLMESDLKSPSKLA